jgi:hypothetical protein
MLGVRDTRRVAWRREHAPQHYVGYVTVTEKSVRLDGTEHSTGIRVSLSIPYDAIETIRVARDAGEEVVGERAVVLELRKDSPIFVRPLQTGVFGLDSFARRLRPN